MIAGRQTSSKNKEWCTPRSYVKVIRRFFGTISLDPCSNRHSVVGAEKEFRLLKKDGLHRPWNYPTIFVNPPYGFDTERGTRISDWLCKCSKTHKKYSSEVVALIPVATNTRHWKDFVFATASSICFLKEARVKFVNPKDPTDTKGAPMACAFVYWGKKPKLFRRRFKKLGFIIQL